MLRGKPAWRWTLTLLLLGACALWALGCGPAGEGGDQTAGKDKALADKDKAQAGKPVARPAGGGEAWLNLAREALQQDRPRRAYGMVEEAARVIWSRLGFFLARALLVSEPARGYGIYTPRKDNLYLHSPPDRPVFPGKGMPIYVYLEPVGYRVQRRADGFYRFGVSMDAALLDSQGNLLFGKEKFLRQEMTSHRFNREFFLNVTLNLKGAPPGEYQLRLTVQDILSDGRASVQLPIRIVVPTAPPGQEAAKPGNKP